MITLGTKIDDELANKFRRLCKRLGLNVNQGLCECIEFCVEMDEDPEGSYYDKSDFWGDEYESGDRRLPL